MINCIKRKNMHDMLNILNIHINVKNVGKTKVTAK